MAAPIEKGSCPSPYCGINVDSADDDEPIIEVQDADLGISYRFDKAKFTDEQAKVWVAEKNGEGLPGVHTHVRSWIVDGWVNVSISSMALTSWKLLKATLCRLLHLRRYLLTLEMFLTP